MKRLLPLILMLAMLPSCKKDGPVLPSSKATLHIVESHAGIAESDGSILSPEKHELKPLKGTLTLSRVSDYTYDIRVDYTFNAKQDKSFTLVVKNVPFIVDQGLYRTESTWLSGAGVIGSEAFDFTTAAVTGTIGTAAETQITLNGTVNGERFEIEISKVSHSSSDVPSYPKTDVAVEQVNYNYMTFSNDSGMDCELILSFGSEQKKMSIRSGNRHGLKMLSGNLSFWEYCSHIEVDYSNGNHAAGAPSSLVGMDPDGSAVIKRVAEDTFWFLSAAEDGRIFRWTYPCDSYSISYPIVQ